MTEASVTGAPKPTWRKIVDYPLVEMVIAVALFIAATAAAVAVGRVLPPMDKDVSTIVRGALSLAFVLATYKLVITRLGEQPRDDLLLAGAGKGFGIGAGIGFGIMTLCVAIAALAGVYRIEGPGTTGQLVTELVGMALLHVFLEEILFRGILFRWMEEFGGSWFALAATSALFGFGHIYNPGATVFSSLAIAIEAGVLLGGAYMLTRSLWLPIGLHAAWNFTQGEVWDVPVSGIDTQGLVTAQLSGHELLAGGGFGLEASVIALVIATGTGIWFVTRAVREGQLMRPHWVRARIARGNVSVPSTADA